MPIDRDAARRFASKRLAVIVVGGLAGLLVGLAAVYGIGTWGGNAAEQTACRAAVTKAAAIAPLARGEVAALAPATQGLMIPDLTFHDAAGKSRTLQDFRGRTVLFNMWATWCVPCRREMPALDTLQRQLGGPDFQVVAVNIDTNNPDKPKAWLKEVGISALAYYADPSAKVFQQLKSIGRAVGLPTSILIGPSGCEIGHMAGPAEWASPDAVKLIESALKPAAKPAAG